MCNEPYTTSGCEIYGLLQPCRLISDLLFGAYERKLMSNIWAALGPTILQGVEPGRKEQDLREAQVLVDRRSAKMGELAGLFKLPLI